MAHFGGDDDNPEYYGSVADGDTYFSMRLHEEDWSSSGDEDKEKALLAATRDIDRLRYAGYKAPVFDLLATDPDATEAEIEAAGATQELQFPRGDDADVPRAIVEATYELAHELLMGRDPAREIENLILSSDRIGNTGVSRDTGELPARHLSNGIVSFHAWRLLLPYLADVTMFDVRRVN